MLILLPESPPLSGKPSSIFNDQRGWPVVRLQLTILASVPGVAYMTTLGVSIEIARLPVIVSPASLTNKPVSVPLANWKPAPNDTGLQVLAALRYSHVLVPP